MSDLTPAQQAEVAALLAARKLVHALQQLIEPDNLTDLTAQAATRQAWTTFDRQLGRLRDRTRTVPAPRRPA
jgi:hypothetical protein